MSTKQESSKPAGQTKKFGKGEREIPHHTQKAKKYYPAEDEYKPKKVRGKHCYQITFFGICLEFKEPLVVAQRSRSS